MYKFILILAVFPFAVFAGGNYNQQAHPNNQETTNIFNNYNTTEVYATYETHESIVNEYYKDYDSAIAQAVASGKHQFSPDAIGFPLQWSTAIGGYNEKMAVDFALFKRLNQDGLLINGSIGLSSDKNKTYGIAIGGRFNGKRK